MDWDMGLLGKVRGNPDLPETERESKFFFNYNSHKMVSIYSVLPFTSNFCPAPSAKVSESLNEPR